MAPWLKEAKVGRIGPFIAMVPKSFDATPEAMIQPAKAKNPNLIVTGTTISIYDSKKRAITIDYNASTGEFTSYTYIPSLLASLSFTDQRLDGSLERLVAPIRKK